MMAEQKKSGRSPLFAALVFLAFIAIVMVIAIARWR